MQLKRREKTAFFQVHVILKTLDFCILKIGRENRVKTDVHKLSKTGREGFKLAPRIKIYLERLCLKTLDAPT